MDFYIEFLLKKHELEEIGFYSNLYKEINLKTKTKYPCFNEECGKCGHCKTKTLDNLNNEEFVIYIGDGHSDRCVCEKADMIFAKDSLREYCESYNIKYFRYNNFLDVLNRLRDKI